MFLFLLIGVLLFIFYEGKTFINPNDVFLDFILNEIPKGFLGVIIAAVFSATMSSIDSSLNSMTTVFFNDILLPIADHRKLKINDIKVTRYCTIFFGVIILYFSFIVSKSNVSILESISKYGSYILGSTLGIFILGLYTKKTNEKGGIIGFVGGIIAVIYVSRVYEIFWMWNNLVGVVASMVIAYISSYLIGSNSEENLKNLLQNKRVNNRKEQGVYLYSGKWEKKSYLLLIYFCILIVVLLYMQR